MSSETTSTADVAIALCEPAHRDEQAALYDECFGKDDGAVVLRWRYDSNPHGRAVSLLARTPDGQAVSGYACNVRRARALGLEVGNSCVGQTGDVMTLPDWRKRGIFARLDRAAMEETARRGWPVVFGLPNRQSERIFVEKLGWDLVGRIRPWTFVLAVEPAAREERLRAGRLAAWGVPWAYWRGTMRRGKLQSRAWERVNTLAIARFDDEVDALSAEVERRFAWMVHRGHDYLNWRFIDAPSGQFRAHGVYDADGALQGYAVVQLPRPGGKVGYLVDVLARDEVALAAAIDGALGHLQKAGAAVARAWAVEGSWWQAQLRDAGFRAPKRDDFKAVIAYVHDPAHPLGVAARDPRTWYFTDGDRDDELVS